MANFTLKQGLPYKVKGHLYKIRKLLIGSSLQADGNYRCPNCNFPLCSPDCVQGIHALVSAVNATNPFTTMQNTVISLQNTVITICSICTTISIININTYLIYISNKVNFQLQDSQSLSKVLVVHSIQNFVFPLDGLHRSATFLSRKTSSSRPRISKGQITSTAVLPFSGKTIQCKNFMTFAVTFHRFFVTASQFQLSSQVHSV